MRSSLRAVACLAAVGATSFAACSRGASPPVPPATTIPVEPFALAPNEEGPAPAANDGPPDAAPPEDALAAHLESKSALLALFDDARAMAPFDFDVGLGHINQGNRAVSRHEITRGACLRGLAGMVLQTPEQRARCGAENMVPVHERGDARTAKFCIDLFEFPNKPCELPFVWTSPSAADKICKAQGKRLCDQSEWNLACRADPAGGNDRLYAYGDDLDLTICNTNKSRRDRAVRCTLATMASIWETCTTDTEPAGSYPRCRSRFGVFDMHGNVAEIMMRKDWDGLWYSQLKGSAFHYVDVAKRPQEGPSYYERYPDHCNFDPRWHVERIEQAAHVNYHLGFRCCKTLESHAARADAGLATSP